MGTSRVSRLDWLLFLVAISSTAALLLGACSGGGNPADEAPTPTMLRAERLALAHYRSYLEENAGDLIDWTRQLRGQIVAGEASRAQSRYATARVQYGQIRPMAEVLSHLDSRFHRLERRLFATETTAGLKGPAKDLLAATEVLRHRLATVDLAPRQIAVASSAALRQLSRSTVLGKEEPYADLDLVDVAAGLEGAEAAFRAVAPLLASGSNRELTGRIEAGFEHAYRELRLYGATAHEPGQARRRAAGAVFVIYSELSPAEIRTLQAPIAALSVLAPEVPGRLRRIMAQRASEQALKP